MNRPFCSSDTASEQHNFQQIHMMGQVSFQIEHDVNSILAK